jgi:hypothetical protein
MGISWKSAADDHEVPPAQTPRNRSNAMTAARITARSLIALSAAMALMLAVVLATFSAASSDHAASTWHKVSAASTWHKAPTAADASTWHKVLAASTWHAVSTSTDASTWH